MDEYSSPFVALNKNEDCDDIEFGQNYTKVEPMFSESVALSLPGLVVKKPETMASDSKPTKQD